jgi:hypothetical protein
MRIKDLVLALLVLASTLEFKPDLLAAQPGAYSDAPAEFGRPTQLQNSTQAQDHSPSQNCSLAELARQQQDVIALQKEHARSAEVTVLAPVCRLLPDDTVGLQHEKFLLSLTNGTTILVAHDTSYAPRVPLQLGSVVRIHGEYIWNPKGGLVHWTHLSDSPFHDSGWIDYQGKRYQ